MQEHARIQGRVNGKSGGWGVHARNVLATGAGGRVECGHFKTTPLKSLAAKRFVMY